MRKGLELISMLSIVIRYDKMNETQTTELNQEPLNNNSEFYLLIIMIKLSILITVKIGQALVRLYRLHNKKVIDRHDSTTIARLKELTTKVGNCENGLQIQIPHI